MTKTEHQVLPKNSNISFKTSYIIIASLSVLLYANTLKHGFVLDDVAVVENNRFVNQGIRGIPDIFTTFYWEGYWNSNAGLYRPLPLVTFAIEYQISPANPFIHHLFNVLLYAVVCCLLFEFLCKTFHKVDQHFFLFAVLLFIVHPIHTEVVANIKSRDEILSLLFFLLCCRQLYSNSVNIKKKVILASSFFFLALLSKEGAVVFLPIIFLLDYHREKSFFKIVQQRLVLLFTTILWFGLHQYVILKSTAPKLIYTSSDNSLFATSSLLEQKATAFGMFARYIVKAFFPYQLSYDYSFNQIPIVNFTSILALTGLILFAGLIYLAFKNFKINPLLTFCLAMIILPLCLTGNIFFNIGATMADRFLFIPTIGSCILICWGIYKLFKINLGSKVSSASVQISFALILVLFSVRSYTRNKDWKDNFTLFQKDVLTVPNSARARYNNALVLQELNGKIDLNACRKEYEECLKIDPAFQDALINLGIVYTRQKEYVAAIRIYHKALSKDPGSADLLGNIGDTFYRSGAIDSSIYYLQRAHLAGNSNTESFNILGTAFFSKQKYQEAQAAFEQGIQKDTSNWSLYLNYGNVLAASNKFDKALQAFKHSYRLNTSNAQTFYFMALTYSKLGDTVNANRYLNEYQNFSKK